MQAGKVGVCWSNVSPLFRAVTIFAVHEYTNSHHMEVKKTEQLVKSEIATIYILFTYTAVYSCCFFFANSESFF